MRGLRGLLVVGLLLTSTMARAGVPQPAEGPCRLRGVVVDEGERTLVLRVRGWEVPLVVEGDTLDAAHALRDVAVEPGVEGPEAVLVGIVARKAGGPPIFFVQSVWVEGLGHLTDDEGSFEWRGPLSTAEYRQIDVRSSELVERYVGAARRALARKRGYFDAFYGNRASRLVNARVVAVTVTDLRTARTRRVAVR